jgi:hypothetical protein
MTTTQPRAFVFVLMPFAPAFDDVYNLGIKAACTDAGAYCERVDEQIFHESILQRVYNQIAKADIVVADMTDRNPNVFYEAGYAHALGKVVILLTQKFEDIPFDLKHYPHIVYSGRISDLKPELERRLRWCIEHPCGVPPPEFSSLQFFLRGRPVTKGSTVGFSLLKRSKSPYARVRLSLALHNSGNGVLDLSHTQVGLIMPREFKRCAEWETAYLPDDKCIHLITDLGALPPEGWKPIVLTFDVRGLGEEIYGEWECVLRIFERFGFRDTPFELQVLKRIEAYEIDVENDAEPNH